MNERIQLAMDMRALGCLAILWLVASPLHAQTCLAPVGLACSSDCAADTITVSWANPEVYTSIDVIVTDMAGVVTHSETLPGADTMTTIGALPAERYLVTVTALCPNAGTGVVSCDVLHAPYAGSGFTDFIYAAEGSGSVDSVSALSDALRWQGLNVVVLDDIASYPCFGPPDPTVVLWVCLGTFPNNHVLTTAEATVLTDFVNNGMSVYVEGSDVWSGPTTAFSAMNGVDEALVSAGDDSLTEIELVPFDCYVQLPDTVPYQQDNAQGDDSTDRAVPLSENGGTASVIFQNSIDDPGQSETAYATTVLLDSGYYGYGPGNVITSSWEFGGFGGDQYELAFAFRQQLSLFVFIDLILLRGDCNGDSAINIADPIAALGYLFDPMVPSLNCAYACDVNFDDTIDIADPVSLLNSLFGSGPPLPTQCNFVSCSFELSCDIAFCP